MLILQRQPADWHVDNKDNNLIMEGNLDNKTVDIIRNSAQKVVCYREDMVFAPGRSNVMTMQPLPDSARDLSNIVHTIESTRNVLGQLAKERGFKIEFDTEESGLIWLQGGGISAKQNRIIILTFVRRPTSRASTVVPSKGEEPSEESLFRGIVERPVAEGQFVQSSFTCQLGGILVVEGGERLLTHKPGGIDNRDLCMVTNVHPTVPQEPQS